MQACGSTPLAGGGDGNGAPIGVGGRKDGHVGAFLIETLGGRERWTKMKKSIKLNMLLSFHVCKYVNAKTAISSSLFEIKVVNRTI